MNFVWICFRLKKVKEKHCRQKFTTNSRLIHARIHDKIHAKCTPNSRATFSVFFKLFWTSFLLMFFRWPAQNPNPQKPRISSPECTARPRAHEDSHSRCGRRKRSEKPQGSGSEFASERMQGDPKWGYKRSRGKPLKTNKKTIKKHRKSRAWIRREFCVNLFPTKKSEGKTLQTKIHD